MHFDEVEATTAVGIASSASNEAVLQLLRSP